MTCMICVYIYLPTVLFFYGKCRQIYDICMVLKLKNTFFLLG